MHEFVNSLAAFVARLVATVAPFAVVELLGADIAARNLKLRQERIVRLVGSFATGADAAQKPLAQDCFEGRGDEEWLHAHVDHAGDGARGVVGVQGSEDEVAGEGSLDGDLSRLQVARFPHHDAIGILPEESAQDAGESQPDIFVHRHLDDAFEVIFHRFLGGEEFGVDGVDLAETGIKGGGFSRAGRSRDNKNSVRPLNDLEDVGVDIVRHPEHLEIEVDGGAIEHAQHHAFAELRGQGGDAQIDVAPGDVFLDAAVLGQAALRDIHIGHDLDAGDDGQRQVPGRGRHFVKRAVHAVTNLELVFEGLEVNVAGPVLDGLVHDQIDKADNGRGIGFGLDGGGGVVAAELQHFTGFPELLEDFLHARGVGAVILLDAFLDLLGRGHDDVDILAEGEAQIFGGARIERIGQGQPQGVAGKADGQGAMEAGQSAGDQL